VARGTGAAGTAEAGPAGRPPGARTIDEILGAARARLRRVTPAEAFAAFSRGAALVDIRPQAQRAREGGIPGALIVERNVLEWRFDPASDARLPWVHGYGEQVIVFCSEGYTSSLAAAALQDLGLASATDIAGGFVAWAADGLPVCPPGAAGAAGAGGAAERAC
jgi:rhodanese-related sulfurtransferase